MVTQNLNYEGGRESNSAQEDQSKTEKALGLRRGAEEQTGPDSVTLTD